MKNILVFATTFPSFLEGDATPGFVYDFIINNINNKF